MILKPPWSALGWLGSFVKSGCCLFVFFFFGRGRGVFFFWMKTFCNGIFCVWISLGLYVIIYEIPNCESQLFLGRNSSKAKFCRLVFS